MDIDDATEPESGRFLSRSEHVSGWRKSSNFGIVRIFASSSFHFCASLIWVFASCCKDILCFMVASPTDCATESPRDPAFLKARETVNISQAISGSWAERASKEVRRLLS